MKKINDIKKNCINIWFIGLCSLIWLVLRSGRRLSRLQYPCQRIALINSFAFFGWLISFFSGHFLYRQLKNLSRKKILIMTGLVFLIFGGIKGCQNWRAGEGYRNLIKAQGSSSKVVRITNNQATINSGNAYYQNVNQLVVNQMMDEAILALTGKSSINDAWDYLFRLNNQKRGKGNIGYRTGEKIAIKVNFNNSCCLEEQNALPHTINAITRQLIYEKGVSPTSIYIYDASRNFLDYFRNGLQYGVQQIARNIQTDSYYTSRYWSSEKIFGRSVSQLVLDAEYIINVPLLRGHAIAGVSLSFKNHYGSLDIAATDQIHNIRENNSNNPNNPLVILNSQPYLKNKTILVVGDGLFALANSGIGPHNPPTHRTNTLFLSADSVSADKVMFEYLRSIGGSAISSWGGNYLAVADNLELGEADDIDLIECDNGKCPKINPSGTYLKGDVDHNGIVESEDVRKILFNFAKDFSLVDNFWEPQNDFKVNSFDFAWVKKDWGKN